MWAGRWRITCASARSCSRRRAQSSSTCSTSTSTIASMIRCGATRGGASMSPYEIEKEGGSVERWNDEPGETWLRRLLDAYPKAVWLNPVPQKYWTCSASIGMIRQIVEDRMFPLTLDGLDRAMRRLTR